MREIGGAKRVRSIPIYRTTTYIEIPTFSTCRHLWYNEKNIEADFFSKIRYPPHTFFHLHVSSPGGVRERGRLPGATVVPAPAQDVEAPLSSRRGASAVVPGTAVLPTPLEHFQMPVGGRPRAGVLGPGAAVLPTPLEHLEVSTPSGVSAGAVVPGASVRSARHEERKMYTMINTERP